VRFRSSDVIGPKIMCCRARLEVRSLARPPTLFNG